MRTVERHLAGAAVVAHHEDDVLLFTTDDRGQFNHVDTQPVRAQCLAHERDISDRERRVLVCDGGAWKIASQITLGADGGTESQINNLDYRLLHEKNTQEAIELLKIKVWLYPRSWNVSDSLAEASAVAGQNSLALQNYEKSLQLNPENEGAKAAMPKLKAK